MNIICIRFAFFSGSLWSRRPTARAFSAIRRSGFANVNTGTDPRLWFSVRTFINRGGNDAGNSRRRAGLFVTLKPSSMFSVSTGPEWTREHTVAQYVDTETDPTAGATDGERYVFGRLEQHELSFTTRLNLVLSPTVSLRMFAQPLISSGEYRVCRGPRPSASGQPRVTMCFS